MFQKDTNIEENIMVKIYKSLVNFILKTDQDED